MMSGPMDIARKTAENRKWKAANARAVILIASKIGRAGRATEHGLMD